jgi:filamin
MNIEVLKDGFKDGLALINLLEVLSGKSLGKYNKHPRIPMQKMENITLGIEFIKSEGIKIVNIGTEDLFSGNLRIILGLIWTLILNYELKFGDDDKNAAAALLEWVNSKVGPYGYEVTNFTKDWNDGKIVCALANAIAPGLIPDHADKATETKENKLNNCSEGIQKADEFLGVDQLILPNEMIQPKVDKLAMMTYVAQYRNIADEDIKFDSSAAKPAAPAVSDASRCKAFGPGLVEAIVDEPANFKIVVPSGISQKPEVKIEGPTTDIAFKMSDSSPYDVSYTCTVPGEYKIHVTVGGEHIPGSTFTVLVLEAVSLGGEGQIRIFFSTTSSNPKTKADTTSLELLLTKKKVHLRPDFVPWLPVDIMEKEDRDAVFKKAGTRALPIVFIDDAYIGDYDAVEALEEKGELDKLLAMNGQKLVSEEEHLKRLAAQ